MTYVYGAGNKKAENYYLKSLPINFDQDVGKKIFILFYEFLENLFNGNEFFKVSVEELIKTCQQKYKKDKQIFIITSDFCKIPLDYYCLVNFRVDRENKKSRDTVVFTRLTNKFDSIKT